MKCLGCHSMAGGHLGALCITLAELWHADRDGLQGVFLQPIAQLLAKKATQQTARARVITDRRELCRGSLALQVFIKIRRLAFAQLAVIGVGVAMRDSRGSIGWL